MEWKQEILARADVVSKNTSCGHVKVGSGRYTRAHHSSLLPPDKVKRRPMLQVYKSESVLITTREPSKQGFGFSIGNPLKIQAGDGIKHAMHNMSQQLHPF